MRNDEELRRLIHEAADACLSGADAMPSRHDAIMHCIKKEKKVEKKKVSFALVCAIVLTLVLAGAAVAAGLVRMSHFSDVLKEDQPWDAERLSRVDQLTVDLGQTIHLTTPEVESDDTVRGRMLAAMGGRTFELTIDEVYCNGNKLYYTYSFTHDDNLVFTGEGKPSGFDAWDVDWPGKKWEDIASLGNDQYWADEDAWFAAHPQDSWFGSLTAGVGDGADLADGTRLRIWDSWLERVDAHTERAFYEVELPEGYEAGESVDIVMTVMYGGVLNYVNASGVHWAHMVPADNRGILRVPVTVPVTGSVTQLMGDMEPKEYGAHARLLVSDFDVTGTVTVEAAEGWNSDLDEESGDYVCSYKLIADGEEKENINGSVSPIAENGTYEIGMRFNLPASTEHITLRPVRRISGVVVDGSEDIVLR